MATRMKIAPSLYRSAAAPTAAGPTMPPTPNRSRAALKPVEGRSRKTSELRTEGSALMNITPDPKRTADAATAANYPGATPRSPAAPRVTSVAARVRRSPKRATASPVASPENPKTPSAT